MTHLDIKEEKDIVRKEYNAIKHILGDMLLEHTEEKPEDIKYYTRKLEEARRRLKK